MSREALHDLIERIPEEEILAAQRFEYLARNPAFRSALSAPLDDEAVTKEDEEAMIQSIEDIKAGRVVSHQDVLREFGLT